MNILAVDTALGACSTAVLAEKMVLAHLFEPMERGHAERLAPMVRDAMQAAGLSFDDVDRLAVTIGPGTFTGQRVGYAFMRALRLALKRPLVGVTTLEVMAQAAIAETGAAAAAVLHDARRGEVYLTSVTAERVVVPVQLAGFEDALGMICQAAQSVGGAFALAGTAAGPATAKLREIGIDVVNSGIVSPDALWVARMANSAAEPGTLPRPLYLRAPDARLPSVP